MTDSRYHLVSIAAVFLALSIGVVLGSTGLQGPTYDVPNRATWALQDQLDRVSGLQDAAQVQVSTVDDADLVSGQTLVIQALATQLHGGEPGSYGIAAIGASAFALSPIAHAERHANFREDANFRK